MFSADEAAGKGPLHRRFILEFGRYLAELLQRCRVNWESTARLSQRMVRPAVAVAFYLTICLLIQTIAPDYYRLPQEWSWNLVGGLSLGLLMALGFAYTPVVFLAYLLPLIADGSIAIEAVRVFTFALSNALVYGLACYAARRTRIISRVDLEDHSILVVIVTLIPFISLADALVGTLNWWSSGTLIPGTVIESLMIDAFGNGMGLLLAVPFVLLIAIPSLNILNEGFKVSGLVAALRSRSGDWMQGIALLAASAAGSAVAMGASDMDRLEAYLLIFVPLTAMALRFGLRGLAGSFLVVGCARFLTTAFGYPVRDGLEMESTVLAALLSSLIVASLATERTGRMSTARMQRGLMNAIALTAQQVLNQSEREEDLDGILKSLVTDLGATRIYVRENEHEPQRSDHPVYYEYCKPGVGRDIHLAPMLETVRKSLVSEHKELLAAGGILQCRTGELPAADQVKFQDLNIHTAIVVPIFDEEQWWGCLGVERSVDQIWSECEVSTLGAAVRVLGSLLSHANVEDQLGQFAGSVPFAFWIGQPDGRAKSYISPAFEQIWGLSADTLSDDPEAWMGAIHYEDHSRIQEELSKQCRGEYDVEYRVLQGGGTIRWVRDTAFPVRNAFGTVSRIVGIAQDTTRQKEAEDSAEQEIWTSRKKTEISHKEIHHRVKNNLELISSLFNLRAMQIGDDRTLEAVRDSQNRVQAMALVHKQLYESVDPERIDFSGYVQELTQHLFRAYRRSKSRVRLGGSVESVSLNMDTTILCGLIINELVSNSLKHAFPGKRGGKIEVSLTQDHTNRCKLMVRDDGVGFSAERFLESKEALGLRFVRNLVERLEGSVQYKNDDGAAFAISFRP